MAVLKPKQREAVFRAIADPTRREILGLLRHRKHTVGELAGNFRTSRPAMGMGRPFKVEGVYRIIERPRVLAFTWLPSWDEDATERLVRFDLDERHGTTTVRLTHSGFTTEGSRARHQGWPQILGWLKMYAEG